MRLWRAMLDQIVDIIKPIAVIAEVFLLSRNIVLRDDLIDHPIDVWQRATVADFQAGNRDETRSLSIYFDGGTLAAICNGKLTMRFRSACNANNSQPLAAGRDFNVGTSRTIDD